MGREKAQEQETADRKGRVYHTTIRDTVGVTIPVPKDQEPPKEGAEVEVRVGRKRFRLVITTVYKRKDGAYRVWAFLRRGAGDGPAFRKVRLRKAAIYY